MAEGVLKVNFSEEEASSEAKSFDPIPTGNYYCKITDITLKAVSESTKNPANIGKPYWNIEFTVQDGEYADRKVWSNCMLFEGALYTLAQLCKATDKWPLKNGIVPDAESFISKDVKIRVVRARNEYMEKREQSEVPIYSNDVKSIAKYDGELITTGTGSLLP